MTLPGYIHTIIADKSEITGAANRLAFRLRKCWTGSVFTGVPKAVHNRSAVITRLSRVTASGYFFVAVKETSKASATVVTFASCFRKVRAPVHITGIGKAVEKVHSRWAQAYWNRSSHNK